MANNSRILGLIEGVRADLSNTDYSTVVSSDQIHDLVSAVEQLTQLSEQLFKRILDLERVQNERSEG